MRRILEQARPDFDELLLLKFAATNTAPFPFFWINEQETLLEYSALLSRVSRQYTQRFGTGV